MDQINCILRQKETFYGVLQKYDIIKETITSTENSYEVSIQTNMKVNYKNFTQFPSQLLNLIGFNDIELEINIVVNELGNSLKYNLKNLTKNTNEELFSSEGCLLFDNENNLMIHESEINTNSKIIKFSNLKSILEKSMEKDIKEIFSKLKKLL